MECHKIFRHAGFFLIIPLVSLAATGCGGKAIKAEVENACYTVLWGERATDADKAESVTVAAADKKLPAKAVMGILTDRNGNQLSGAVVQLTSTNNKVALTDTTNIAGRFTFTDGRLNKTVSLRFDKQGYRCAQLGDVPVDGSKEITVRLFSDDRH